MSENRLTRKERSLLLELLREERGRCFDNARDRLNRAREARGDGDQDGTDWNVRLVHDHRREAAVNIPIIDKLMEA